MSQRFLWNTCPHSHTESSLLLLTLPQKSSQARVAVSGRNVPTIARNRYLCVKILPLSYGIVVFASDAKIASLRNEIVIFWGNRCFTMFSGQQSPKSVQLVLGLPGLRLPCLRNPSLKWALQKQAKRLRVG